MSKVIKTTTTTNMEYWLGKQNKKVLLIDFSLLLQAKEDYIIKNKGMT